MSYADTMVFVIDASASMNAKEDGMKRFERAIEIALDRVEGRNTIILAADRSQMVLERGGSNDAKQMLEGLEATDAASNNFYEKNWERRGCS